MLSHNLILVVCVLAVMAAAPAYLVGAVPARVLWRSGVVAVVSGSIYLFYVRPLVQGWNSTGNPTPVLVSFAAHAGIPTIALALLGCALVLRWGTGRSMLWWALMFAGSLCVFQLAGMS